MNKIIKNEMKMEFLSKSTNEAFARIAVASFASQLDPTIEEIADIKTSVSDNGAGIENVKEAREPLFTTKGNLERSGMGFTIMENFMDEMSVESIVGLGTKIVMSKKIKKETNTY